MNFDRTNGEIDSDRRNGIKKNYRQKWKSNKNMNSKESTFSRGMGNVVNQVLYFVDVAVAVAVAVRIFYID